MSQGTSGGDIRLECLAIILRKCIGTDEQKIKELVVSLREDGILKSREERRSMTRLIENGKTDAAIQLMVSKVYTSKQGIKYFLGVLDDEELVEDKRYPEILSQVLEETHSSESRTGLVSLWGELESFQQDVKPVVSQIWPEHKQLSTESWPLGLIHFCLKSSGEDLQKVQDFVSSVSLLQRQRADSTQSDDEIEPEKTYCTETSLGSDLGGPESVESFVVISEDGENAAEKPIETSQEAIKERMQEAIANNDDATENPTETSVDSQEAINKRMQDAVANNYESPTTSMTASTPPLDYVSEESSMVTSASSIPKPAEEPLESEEDSTGAEEQEFGSLKTTNASHYVQGATEATSVADVSTFEPEEQSLARPSSADRSFDDQIDVTAPAESNKLNDDTVALGEPVFSSTDDDEAMKKQIEKAIAAVGDKDRQTTQMQNDNVIAEPTLGRNQTVGDAPNWREIPSTSIQQRLKEEQASDVRNASSTYVEEILEAESAPTKEKPLFPSETNKKQAFDNDKQNPQIRKDSIAGEPRQEVNEGRRDASVPRESRSLSIGRVGEVRHSSESENVPGTHGDFPCDYGNSLPVGVQIQLERNVGTSAGDELQAPGTSAIEKHSSRLQSQFPTTDLAPGSMAVERGGWEDVNLLSQSDDDGDFEEDGQEANESMSFYQPEDATSTTISYEIGPSLTTGFTLPVTQQPCTTSDGLMAERMQIQEAMRASQEPKSILGKIRYIVPNISNPFGKTVSARVQFRVYLKCVDRYKRGYWPAVKLGGHYISMTKHSRMGYFYADYEAQCSTLKYCYTLVTTDRQVSESLPQQSRKRVVKLDGDTVTHDVACFRDTGESKWKEMVDKKMKKYLPAPSEIFRSNFRFVKSDVFHWIRAALTGWRLVEPKSYVYRWQDKDVEQTLKDWLASIAKTCNGSRDHLEKHALYSLGVVVSLFELKHTIRNPKLFTRICKGLETQALNHAQQIQLFQKIHQHFLLGPGDVSTKQNIRGALNILFGNAEHFWKAHCLLILPLYMLIDCEGEKRKRITLPVPDLLYTRALLPCSTEQQKWNKLREKVLKDSSEKRKLLDLADVIRRISENHDWMVDTYQYFVSEDILIELIEAKHGLAEKFQLDSVFTQILPLIEPQNFSQPKVLQENRTKVARLSVYLTSQFARMSDQQFVQSLTKDARAFAAKSTRSIGDMLFQTLCRIVTQEGSVNTSERNSISWIISMSTAATNLCYNLDHVQSCGEESIPFIDQIFEVVRVRISEYVDCGEKLSIQEVQFYNNLFSKTWCRPQLQKKWVDLLENEVKSVIDEKWSQQEDGIDFLEFYLDTLREIELEDALSSLFSDKAVTSAKDAMTSQDSASSYNLLKALKAKGGKKVETVFARSFQTEFRKFQKIGKKNFRIQALQFLTESPVVLRFYRLFDLRTISELFSKPKFGEIEKVNQIAIHLQEELSKGLLTVEECEVVLENQEKATELMALACNVVDFKEEASQKPGKRDLEIDFLFRNCRKELEKYRTEIEAIRFFINFCKALKEKKIHIDCRSLEQLCEKKSYEVKLHVLKEEKLQRNEMDEVLLAYNLKDSHVFYDKAREVARSHYRNSEPNTKAASTVRLEFRTALNKIWGATKASLLEFVKNVDTATLPPESITKSFGFTDGDEGKLREEMSTLYKFADAALATRKEAKTLARESWIKARQLARVFKIQRNLDALKWFDTFCKKNCLEGNFALLQEFQVSYQRLGESEFEKVSGVIDIDQKRLNILKAFTKQEELIDWIKSKSKEESNIHGLCLVAIESTRYNPLQAAKWSCLADAVAGYESLLFNLDKISDLDDLLCKCNKVWDKAEQDKSFVKNWSDVGKDVAWYKNHEKWYGSGEKFAVHFAAEANKRGQYIISNFQKNSNSVNLENSIKLRFRPIDSVSSEPESITMDKRLEDFQEGVDVDYLHGIQSTLTLISSDSDDGKTDIKQFTAVLNAMESLASSYVDLVNAGFMLLNDWEAIASCEKATSEDMMTEHIMTLKITFKKDLAPLTWTVSIQDLNLLAGIQRDALKSLNYHIARMRLRHYFLNEYSIQQIKYLCAQLGRVRQGDLEEQAYLLLSDFPRDKMTQMIRESLNEAIATPDQEDTGDEEEAAPDNIDTSEEITLMRNKRRAVRQLVNAEGTSETVAKAAVRAESYKDLTNCANWILLHEYEEDLVKRLSREFDQGFVCQENDIQEDLTILQDRSARTLEGIIKILQQKATKRHLLEAVKTIFTGYLRNTTTLTLKDCLSVNHLGKFLTILHKKMEAYSPSAMRKMPTSFKEGEPNFILAQSHSVIPLLLSLYTGENSITSLPKPAEVLLCDDSTSGDEIERFMHRAMCRHPSGDNGVKQLFCLTFTEKLNLNVSKVLETVFGKLSKDEHCSQNYQLVIISSDHRHFVSVCFDEHRVEKPDFDDKLIQSFMVKYMTKKTVLKKEKVRVLSSARSGVGKSLYVKRQIESLPQGYESTTVRLLEKDICMERVVKRLLKRKDSAEKPQLIHIDLTLAVHTGVEKFMFDLLILGLIKDGSGKVWRRSESHSYVIEVTKSSDTKPVQTLELLPTMRCQAPKAVLEQLRNGEKRKDALLMDDGEYKSDTFQRPYQYLLHHKQARDLDQCVFEATARRGQNHVAECIELLLEYCGMEDPSWAQLKHFASFLDIQLQNCEKSVFCHIEELKGLKEFAVKFMISMAQDFATPSLIISDESSGRRRERNRSVFEDHQIRRKWEEKEHPFVFFNDDGETMTFINVHIDRSGNLLDHDRNVAKEAFISKDLVKGLHAQKVDLRRRFHTLERDDMLLTLHRIMGLETPPDPDPAKTKHYNPKPYDPDPTYELTTDNVLKMIAIYMRFRCNIPVIIMGETGCGKTRMVEFMSKLQAGPSKTGAAMRTVKVHGGIGVEDIFRSVEEVASSAKKRRTLFYDEANTTTAIYAIKEVMCDSTIDGKLFEDATEGQAAAKNSPIQIVAACNPYKQLSMEALKKMETSGLGYRVATSKTSERLGNIAMRTLVYRVVALPPSIQPFVWDFGKLSEETERIYISKMVASKLQRKSSLGKDDSELIISILSCAQAYMKKQKSECRYVSLRDVERTIKLYKWFVHHKNVLFPAMDKELSKNQSNGHTHPIMQNSLRCLLQAIGISYHVSLENRKGFREEISSVLKDREILVSQYDIQEEYRACQTVFHRNLKSEDNVAWNEALRENVFLMAVCTDVKLPLFLIGKPGSSKSLAKTIVEVNMKGTSSSSPLFQELKKVEVFSFQCSALTKAAGIQKIFTNAVERQKNNDLKMFTSLVVLDEIGLAEDSIHMPLKILHPLLESGNADTGSITEFKEQEKVAFTGISNWALDPAKMNRGIFVTRGAPSETDLFDTAQGIFHGNYSKIIEHHTLLENLTAAYLEVYQNQGDQFFGLRDYYSLIKMIRSMCAKQQVDKKGIAYVLLRNFSGGKEEHQRALANSITKHLDLPGEHVSVASLQKLVTDNIESEDDRFLLLLTVQHSSLHLLRHIMPDFDEAQVIFGSSFPGDHTYAVLCKSINRIKVCMEKGKKAILLNMTDIHESLYDVLNQHYVTFADQRYVAIGLGGHRVWTPIHKKFRLIVIERKETVHDEYPIPLINRLEKHHLVSKSLLTTKQNTAEQHLAEWSEKFANTDNFKTSSTFIGYHEDTPSSVVLAYSDESTEFHKKVLLQVATPDSLYRLSKSGLSKEKEKLMQVYMEEQTHDSLFSLLKNAKNRKKVRLEIFDVMSFSSILTEDVRKVIEQKLNLLPNSVMLLFLQQFKVEEEYTKKLDDFFSRCSEEQNLQKPETTKLENVAILLIQTAKAQKNGTLIECAKHNFMNKLVEVNMEMMKTDKIIIAFISSTARNIQHNGSASKFSIQHSREWNAVYVDELRHLRSNSSTTLISSFYNKSISDILNEGVSLLDKSNSTQSHVLCLLRDCISVAMAKVSNPGNNGERKLERIRTLQRICSDNKRDILEDVRHSFWKILLQKLVILNESQSKQHNDRNEWIVREACSPEKLQEGGTFGKTIHLHLKHQLADMLAFVVSMIDENNNLALLLSSDVGMEWKWDLWLQLFAAISLGKRCTDQREYSVKTVHHLEMDNSSKFPFSFMIFKEFEILFEKTKNITFESGERKLEQESHFDKRVKEECCAGISKVFQVWNSANCMKMMSEFAHDLLKFCFEGGANSEDELRVMLTILFEYSKKKWSEKNREVNGVAVTFYTFKAIFDHLSTISSVLKICPELKKHVENWITKQEKKSEFLIHEYAVVDFISWTHQKASEIEDGRSCSEWLNVSAQMKKSRKGAITSDERKAELQKKSQPVLLLDSLLTHLLPLDKNEVDYDKYAALVVGQAKKVFRAMEKWGIHSKEVLKIVTTTTRKTYEDLKLSLLMNWQKSSCVCSKKIETPVKMPCGCFICETCSDMKQCESRICPRCCNPLLEGKDGVPPELTSAQRSRLKNFRSSCTSFFLEYLHKHCFSETATLGGKSEENEKLRAIFEGTLLPEKPHLARKGFKLETTKLDLNIATKSSIFLLLLQRNPEFLKDKLNAILAKGLVDSTFLKSVLKGLENWYAKENSYANNATEPNVLEYQERLLRQAWISLNESREKVITLEILEYVAQVRYALTSLVTIAERTRAGSSTDKVAPTLILTGEDICKQPDARIIRSFITKTGAGRYGSQWPIEIFRGGRFKGLIDEGCINTDKGYVDYWKILGERYNLAKTKKRGFFPAKPKSLSLENLPEYLWMLRASPPFTMRPSNTEGEILLQASYLSKHFTGKLFFSSHLGKGLYQLVILAAGIVLCKLPLMKELHDLILDPEHTIGWFWPAMPESIHDETTAVMTEEAPYACPNGHVYYIGDCTYPDSMARCPEPDCKELIGGILHIAAEGNQRLEREVQSQCGYLLHAKKMGVDNPAERITEQAASVIQFFIHSCMLLALERNKDTILRMIGKTANEGHIFLLESLNKNLNGLANGLGCNVDEAIVVLASILGRMFQENPEAKEGDMEMDWSDRDSCREWEEEFRERYLLPVFRQVDDVVLAGKKKMRQEVNETGQKRLPKDEIDQSMQRLTWTNPLLWKYMREPTASHLLHEIADSDLPGGVLRTILGCPHLHLLNHLRSTLRLQDNLIQRYQNRLDMNDAENITFQQIQRRENYDMIKLIDEYIILWNQVFPILRVRYSADKVLTQYMTTITINTPITMAMPSVRGRGRCAKILAEHLIDLQNEFLRNCMDADKSVDRIAEVEVTKLLPTHFVSMNKWKDLLPMVHLHCSYSITTDECGDQYHRISYNIAALEKEAKEKHVTYKRMIKKESLPCIKYAQDVGVGADWAGVEDNVKQVPLPSGIALEIDDKVLRATLADVCEGVRTLTQAIAFLAKVKVKLEDEDKKLHEYLEKDLMLSANHLGMIPKGAKICHTLALYQKLSCHKAECFVRQGLNPYKEFLQGKQEKITEEKVLTKLKDAFEHTDSNSLRQHLNEMLIKAPDFEPWWSLASILRSLKFLEASKNNLWYSRIPEEIKFKHVPDLFRLSIEGIELGQEA